MIEDVAPSSASPCLAAASSSESVEELQAIVAGLQQELIACQRVAMLGSLAAMVNHEFNNLLTPVLARAEAALMSGNAAYMRKSLERTQIQTQRAITVTRHLLSLTQDKPRPRQACNVGEAVHEAVETATRPFEKDGIDLQIDVPDTLMVLAQPDLLCQVLLNLLLNAREAMKDVRGSLSISATGDGDVVEIRIKDTGTGIPEDTLQNVLNPFLAADPWQQPNDWQRIGLGLSVCRMIACEHEAQVQAFGNDGRGCTFQLRWPAASAADRGAVDPD